MGHSKCCEKHCKHKRRRVILLSLLAFVIVVLFVVLVVWLALRPTKPRFTLRDTSVLQLNISSTVEPFALTTILQPTIASRNPNDRIGIYYDKLDVYAMYRSQQITLAYSVGPFYQGHNDVSVWSPVLYGLSVPVSQYVCGSIAQDQTAGIVLVDVMVSGAVRWKVGSWISGTYHLEVSCPAFLRFDKGSTQMRFWQITSCSVDV